MAPSSPQLANLLPSGLTLSACTVLLCASCTLTHCPLSTSLHRILPSLPLIATRYLGSIHDLVLLNPIAGTLSARAALAQVNDTLRTVFAHKA